MAIIKCKMCGGDIELAADKTFGTCEFCGSTMTFPKVDDEQRAAAFNRGNHFRRIGEFDKALAVYERIVREDDTDAEAHWCCALCRFGIEYVEDPSTYEWLPTCHRASFDSFLEDVDYLAAVEHSEGITKRQYQKDGAKIAEIQRGILATSQNEEPFDVFICYKESDESGERTKDSLMAQDVYYQLTDQGYRVFFARITLEDMVGKQYEPYIFAALNSAQVMIVIGTKPEYMSAVWVKNEWSRFLAMMKKDRKKLLLPCYRDMDPYDMPEQLSVLQSYDMSKIGFMQDLIRGIKKVIQTDEPKAAVAGETVAAANANIAPLLKRAFMFLEDEEWASADEYAEKVLDMDPECAEAYLVKLMSELQVQKREDLAEQEDAFEDDKNYQKALRFADDAFRSTLAGYITSIKERELDRRYAEACALLESADSGEKCILAASKFEELSAWKDSEEQVKKCHEKVQAVRKDSIYNLAMERLKMGTDFGFSKAITLLEKIPGWRDADQLRKDAIYNRAVGFMESGEENYLNQAIQLFESISGWRDADQYCDRAEEARKDNVYHRAMGFMESGDKNYLEQSIHLFESISGWRDADQRREEAEGIKKDAIYDRAIEQLNIGTEFCCGQAVRLLRTIPGWRDADQLCESADATWKDSFYNRAKEYLGQNTVSSCKQAITLFESISGWRDADQLCESAGNAWRRLEETRSEKQKERTALLAEQTKLQAELSALKGLFSGGRRREIEASLAELNSQIAKLDEELAKLQ